MNPFPRLLPPAKSSPAVAHREAGKGTAKTTPNSSCSEVAITPDMPDWDPDNERRLNGCKVCGAAVVLFLSEQTGLDPEFCSVDCAREGSRYGSLCPFCAMPPKRAAGAAAKDAPCSRGCKYTLEQIRTVNDALQAMEVRRPC